MAAYQPDLPALFGALSDPTRLAVVARLTEGPASVSALAEPHRMARQSFMKHLNVLETAGIVTSAKKGRVRTVSLQPAVLAHVEDWARWHRDRVKGDLDRLGDYLNLETDND